MSELRQFYETSFAALLCASPEVAAELGIRSVGGTTIPQNVFSDPSPQGDARRRDLMGDTLRRLRGLAARAPAGEALNLEVYEFFLRWANFGHLRGTESVAQPLCDSIADHLAGTQSEILSCLNQWHALANAADAEAYVERVRSIPAVLDGLIEGLQARAAAGNLLPQPLRKRVLAEIEKLLATRGERHPVYQRLAGFDAKRAAPLPDLLEGPIARAYHRLGEYLEQQPAEERLGLWRLAGGTEYYAFLLRAHTTTTLDAAAIHELGRQELSRLQGGLRQKLRATGHAGDSLAQCFTVFDARHKLDWSGTADARAALMDRLEGILREAEQKLMPLFGIRPRAGVQLAAIPELQEPNRHNTYIAPAADGSRPGVFEVNVGQLLGGSAPDLYNLVYHEAVPGHHLQLTIAQELGAELPSFRRILVHDAYIEGWAKYSELLPWREGINTDPLWDIARSRYEIYSTANLVLDTGIHALRWTREQGMAFLREHTGCDAGFANYMVDRSAARPAQACSYKIGMLTLLGARERMERARGAGFDLREFHDSVLSQGSLPLALFDKLIDARIAAAA